MCGIAALFKTPYGRSVIDEMIRLVEHRGPDDEGVQCFDDAALAHRRLSILDLSTHGHQPYSDPTGRYWMTYNGEVYNYLELKKELEQLGVSFTSTCDTEVVLKSYLQWGLPAFQKMNGMFALVIYDSAEKRFLALRDRFGVKPLYYTKIAGGIAFASEIKQFTALPDFQPKLHTPSAHDFLVYSLTDHQAETLFEGVYQLQGGEYLDDFGSPKQWYTPPRRFYGGDFEAAAQELESRLEKAVQMRLRSDVEVGSCLSGGIDSSSLVGLIHQQGSRHKTFSALSEDPVLNEKGYIQEVAERFQIPNESVTPDASELIERLEEMVWHYDLPFSTTSPFAQWKVFELAKKRGVKVMIDGQGADEAFAGYHAFFGNRLYDTLTHPLSFFRELKAIQDPYQALSHLGGLLLPKQVQRPLRKVLGKTHAKPDWLHLDGEAPFLSERRRSLYDHTHLQVARSNLPMLLRFEDRSSMAHSVEARTPFVDVEVMELALSLPSHFKIQEGVTKRVLRQAMEKQLPPRIAARRDKIGFATAEERWMKRERDTFRELLIDSLENTEGLIDSQKALEHFDAIQKGSRAFDSLPWKWISFGQWMKRFF